MVNIATYSIVNNEISYIKDLVDYHLTWVDAMYILDTGSTDGTLEYLKSINDPRVVVEEYPVKYVPQYEADWDQIENPFPEVQVRNYSIKRTEELINPKWMIQLDGDEVWLANTKKVLEESDEAVCIGCSTLNPVNDISEIPIEKRGGFKLFNPHVRIWKAHNKCLYIKNPHFKGKEIHCIPSAEDFGHHLFHHPKIKYVSDNLHIHLHWLYGKKLELYYNKLGIFDKSEMVAQRPVNQFFDELPEIFQQRRREWEKVDVK